ncbi:LexA family transcriptional regulator [Aerococcaceae bacterium DSM 111022]|nr:LexA family transcriptional regulator [Aerococcaceae bacterium DSM 111022]
MEKWNIGENIKNIRLSRNLTLEALANNLNAKYPNGINFNKGKLSKWENNKEEPMLSSIRLLADYYNVTIEDLSKGNIKSNINVIYEKLDEVRQNNVLSYAEEQLEEQNKVINLSDYLEEDLYGYASAGTGQQVFDNPVETIRLHKSDVPTQHYDLTLQVVGDSMEPAFKDGEYIFIKKTESLRNGQFGVFIINGESYLKKVYVEEDHLRLVSLNDKYEDLIFTEDEGITLVGQVVL